MVIVFLQNTSDEYRRKTAKIYIQKMVNLKYLKKC
jgi:hypothetical protein